MKFHLLDEAIKWGIDMERETIMKKYFFAMLLIIIMCFVCACGADDSVNESMSVVGVDNDSKKDNSHVVRLNNEDATKMFQEEFNKFNNVISGVDSAINYYNDNDFTTMEDIEAYEAKWESMSDELKMIQSDLTEKRPPKEYEEMWDGFATCMGELSSILAKGTNFNTNNDGQYTGDEMTALLREIGDEFVTVSYEACDYSDKFSATIKKEGSKSDIASNSSFDYDSGNKCLECGMNAPRCYTNPFSHEDEYYCENHYQEIVDMMDEMERDVESSSQGQNYCEASECYSKAEYAVEGFSGVEHYCKKHYDEMMEVISTMEEDVGAGSYSQHLCESCNKEGTKSIIGFSGETEYYCTEHYNEMVEILNKMLSDY